MPKGSVSVTLRGREFRLRSDDDPEQLRRVAAYLDQTMDQVEKRTGTVDSLGIAILSALNLAREVIELRDAGGSGVDPRRLSRLVELAESALEGRRAAH